MQVMNQTSSSKTFLSHKLNYLQNVKQGVTILSSDQADCGNVFESLQTMLLCQTMLNMLHKKGKTHC